ncbi:MAG: glutamine--fructose-6-phosphate transaminase (isomerizing) [Acidobacteria bacterium]|nr:glutamine--fructose-6-phosphate transaminase (isomerizing) [Acidobacteriota bacterium]
MCGIIGYVGEQQLVPVIVEGLRRLEYRGYDSAGIAVVNRAGHLELRRAAGKLKNLEEVLRQQPLDGVYGLGHTRWATHGRPTEENAHPHRDCTGRVVVVHNGIIENYVALKRRLQKGGHQFVTETDTEVVAHLVEDYLNKDLSLEEAVRRSVKEFEGIFAIAVLSATVPETIVAARQGPPIVLGFGDREYFVASDIPAILQHTRDVSFLGDGELAVVRRTGVQVFDFEGNPVVPAIQRINWDPIMAEKGGFAHFMLKEIFEQPRAVRDTIKERASIESGRVFLDQIDLSEDQLRGMRDLKIVACGTSYHAALSGKYMIEELARMPVEVDYASEFRYRDPIIDDRTLVLAISQSGETADVLAAMRAAGAKGAHVLSICNVLGSTVTREAEGTIYTHAGPEIGVASTKTFVTQLAALYLIAIHLGLLRSIVSAHHAAELIRQLNEIPVKMERALGCAELIKETSREFFRAQDFLYLGRGIQFPIALEGALKLKEISYIHAEGYPAGEMKHGPNALIDERLPVVVINTLDRSSATSRLRYEKTLSNLVEVKAREGIVLAVVTEGDTETAEVAKQVIAVPECTEWLSPLLSIIPLQLLAYHIAVRRGCDVDQPRNLAKSVTVE